MPELDQRLSAREAELRAIPQARLTREEQAELEVGHTTLTPRLSRWIIAVFLVSIVLIPLLQHYSEANKGKAAWWKPSSWSAFGIPIGTWKIFESTASTSLWGRVQAANTHFMKEVSSFEKALEDDSFLAVAAIPPTQEITAKWLGLGNEQVYIGRDGWLFYQPEVAYLTGPGFLEKEVLKARSRMGHEGEQVQPDPLKAILHFRDQLAARGVELLLLPVPVKPMIMPEQLSDRYSSGSKQVLQNPSYKAFLVALEAEKIAYFDASEALIGLKDRGVVPFLQTDTHWTPAGMELAATSLASHLAARGFNGNTVYKSQTRAVSGVGDIAAMLKLPKGSSLYPPSPYEIQEITTETGTPWAPSKEAEILVLGDSFLNIYSLEAMGWGKASGFVEHLSYHLKAPLDAILRNDAAAHAPRGILARELAQGKDRLAGKKLVIWEFAMRELAVGDWKIIDLPTVKPAEVASSSSEAASFFVPESGAVKVTAVVEAVSMVPKPGSVPYKDHIFTLLLKGAEGPGLPNGSRIILHSWSMQENVLTPATSLKPGDKVTVELQAWTEVASQFERFNRSEFDDESLQMELPCWGTKIEKQ